MPAHLRFLAIILIMISLFFVTGCRKTERAAEPVKAETPAALFARLCASCHGPEGNGAGSRPGPPLTSRDFRYGRTREAVRDSIRNGRGNRMPAFTQALDDRQIETLADYVIGLAR